MGSFLEYMGMGTILDLSPSPPPPLNCPKLTFGAILEYKGYISVQLSLIPQGLIRY